MKCPFGYEVGDPPSHLRCPSGFPGCACGDEFVAFLMLHPPEPEPTTDQASQVVGWWMEHSDEF